MSEECGIPRRVRGHCVETQKLLSGNASFTAPEHSNIGCYVLSLHSSLTFIGSQFIASPSSHLCREGRRRGWKREARTAGGTVQGVFGWGLGRERRRGTLRRVERCEERKEKRVKNETAGNICYTTPLNFIYLIVLLQSLLALFSEVLQSLSAMKGWLTVPLPISQFRHDLPRLGSHQQL